MTGKKKTTIIILLFTFLALIAGTAISFYWLKNVYLREKIEANVNANKLQDWYRSDSFHPPVDNRISAQQIDAFIRVNNDLVYLLEHMRRQFENNSWFIAIEMIKMQPEWLDRKYVALKKYNLSPVEYDWIADQVVHFWIYRWKEESIEILNEYGWELDYSGENSHNIPGDYELLLAHENELNLIFDILWPEHNLKKSQMSDSMFIADQDSG